MHSKLNLPSVTLITVTSVDIEKTNAALLHCCELVEFGAVKMLCSQLPRLHHPQVQYILISPIDLLGYSRFIIQGLKNFVETEHCLIIQADGFIVDPSRWQPEFLEFDYIGAPWSQYVDLTGPGNKSFEFDKNRVGNGGFSLRSKKLLEATARLPFDQSDISKRKSEDLFICHYCFEDLRSAGIRFAPEVLAARFSIESKGLHGATIDSVFGFHGKHWMPFVHRLFPHLQETTQTGSRDSGPSQFVSSASFEKPKFFPPITGTPTGWFGHAPFAFWLIETLKPKSLVELGTHYGYSYFCFCQQVLSQKLPTRCAAIDTWKGDEHAGQYDETVFDTVRETNSQHYQNFSSLVRSTFADAADQFPDGSIDLLHIDGRHRYEDVKQDFERWRPKLSDTGIVLFHDTQVQHQDFGVHRYWRELASEFPHFEFIHQYGLGVLGVGPAIPERLRSLFDAASNPDKVAAIRGVYERLAQALGGKRISRTEQCPCGSGERFKHCHGSLVA